MTFGESLRVELKAAGMSCYRLAKLMGFRANMTVYRWRDDHAEPTIGDLLRLVHLFPNLRSRPETNARITDYLESMERLREQRAD